MFNEIVVYEKKLDFATALSKIQEYVKMFPDDENAQKELTFLKSRNGELSTETAAETASDTGAANTEASSDGSDGYDEAGEEEN